MALRAGWCAGRGTLRNDDRAAICVRLPGWFFRPWRIVVVGAMDDIVADRRDLLAVKHRGEGSHAALPQGAIKHDAVPGIDREEGRGSQVGHDATAHCSFTVTDATIAIEQAFSGSYPLGIG